MDYEKQQDNTSDATVTYRRLRWFGHKQRMKESTKTKEPLHLIPNKIRNRDCLRFTGISTVSK